MLFNSLEYIFFLPIVFILFWFIPDKYRWIILVGASYYFYMKWNRVYVLLILFITFVSYLCGIIIEKYKNIKKRILWITVVINLGILFFFKYFNFFIENIVSLIRKFKSLNEVPLLDIILPVGISFYIFQALGYVIDVYREDEKAEHHFGKFAAYISFFPQLVAGPIERTENLLPQIKRIKKFNYENATYGLKKIAWGYYKKIVIADTLAIDVNRIYSELHSYKGLSLIIISLFFSIQIYCDFSGYSDIAIGTAKLFNIDLMENFKSPYFSTSIKEFWSRWHISLSSWFSDYVYIPLGGNRCGKIRNRINIIITFLLSGLWHGAAWTYIIWGGIHGVGRNLEKECNIKLRNKWMRRLWVFIFCTIGWIFFRAPTLQDAIYILRSLFVGLATPVEYLAAGFSNLGIGRFKLLYLSFLLFILIVFDYTSLKADVIKKVSKWPLVYRWSMYIFIGLLIILFSQKGTPEEFIYFQF